MAFLLHHMTIPQRLRRACKQPGSEGSGEMLLRANESIAKPQGRKVPKVYTCAHDQEYAERPERSVKALKGSMNVSL